MKFRLLIAALGLLASFVGKADAQPTSGTKTWGGYSFTWAVENNAGVSIKSVVYNGTHYISNASLPVIRVKYDNNACGPYMDRLGTAFIVKDTAGNYVRMTEVSGKLYVWLKAQVDSYALEQQWIFNSNGRIDARLFSSGLQCVTNHVHNPYWRIDADVGDAVNDEVRVRYNDGRIFHVPNEYNRRKDVAPTVSWWSVYDKNTGRQAVITPGTTDGTANTFSSFDFYGRTYKFPFEQLPWASAVGGFADQGDLVLPSGNGEVTGPGSASTDVLGWYVAHMSHLASAGATTQIAAGPSIQLQ